MHYVYPPTTRKTSVIDKLFEYKNDNLIKMKEPSDTANAGKENRTKEKVPKRQTL